MYRVEFCHLNAENVRKNPDVWQLHMRVIFRYDITVVIMTATLMFTVPYELCLCAHFATTKINVAGREFGW